MPVEAYTASWIEILTMIILCGRVMVEAYTASWIEIFPLVLNHSVMMSRLIQPRGLKYYRKAEGKKKQTSRLIQPRGLKSSLSFILRMAVLGRGLYSLVDWNCKTNHCHEGVLCRGLYSLVDWNNDIYLAHRYLAVVEAYTASWIEIV